MDPHEEYFQTLSLAERQLLVLREILYDGSWDEMIQDLEARREGRPFVFQLKTRIEEDLGRIERLKSYESEHGVDLGDYVALSTESEGCRDE